MDQTTTRPTVNLNGCDGNAFGILARAERAYRAAGRTDEWPAMRERMTAGTYDELLAVLLLECDVTFGDDDADEDE
jgi:hypothetical protein